MTICREVFRAAGSIAAATLTVVLAFAICFIAGALIICAITLTGIAVFAVGFGLVYIVAGDDGLRQAHAFLDAYRTTR